MEIRGVYRFSSLVKQNKEGENCAVFCFAGKRKLLFLILRCDCEAIFFKTVQNILLVEVWADGWAEGEGKGGCGFISLVKKKI